MVGEVRKVSHFPSFPLEISILVHHKFQWFKKRKKLRSSAHFHNFPFFLSIFFLPLFSLSSHSLPFFLLFHSFQNFPPNFPRVGHSPTSPIPIVAPLEASDLPCQMRRMINTGTHRWQVMSMKSLSRM